MAAGMLCSLLAACQFDSRSCGPSQVVKRHRLEIQRCASDVRNMLGAGVPEPVATTVTGHKTRAVFDRYHIVSAGDLQDVARKLTGMFSGTTGGAVVDSRPLSS